MGLFSRAKKAFSAGNINPVKMAQQAQQMAHQQLAQAGYTDGSTPTPQSMAAAMPQMAADQAAAQAYGEELNRINNVGTPGTGVITGAVDTGERTAGNPWYQLDIDVSLPGEASYAVTKRELVPATIVGKYAIGATRAVKVDPADRSKVIFTD